MGKLNLTDSVTNLRWNTDHHYAHIEAQHDFIRAIAVQFELGYSDYRYIQGMLTVNGFSALYDEFTAAYKDFYQYESVFAMRGLDEFNSQFPDLTNFKQARDNLLAVLDKLDET